MFDFRRHRLGERDPSSLPRRGRWKDYRRESLRARGSRPRRDVRLAGDDERRRAAHGRRGDRGAARSRRRDPARAPFPGRCGQPQTARPLPRSIHRRRRQGRSPRCLRARRRLANRPALLPPAHGRRPVVIELREWSRMAEDLQQERNRLANRVREQLWRYYPQALELGDDLAVDWFLDLWALAPTPAKAARLRESRVTSLLKAHRIRRIEAAEVLRILRQKPLVVASGTVEAATAHITAVAARLKLVNQQIKQAHRRLDELADKLAEGREEDAPGQKSKQRDVTILRSLPGVGRIVLATLLGEAAEPLRKRDYHALRTLSGVAPVTRRSGKRCVVLMRQACHLRLRTAVYHWARVAIQHDVRSRARYAELRKRGHSHGRALRSVADRLLAVACAMLKSQTTFDPEHAVEAVAA